MKEENAVKEVQETKDEKRKKLLEKIKSEHPGESLFEIPFEKFPDHLFVCRHIPWGSYKLLIGASKDIGSGIEKLLEMVLVYPKYDYEAMQSDFEKYPAGIIKDLAERYNKELGFGGDESPVKKL